MIRSRTRCGHDPGIRRGFIYQRRDRSAPTEVARQVGGGDAVEAPHPFLRTAVIGVDIVDVELRRARGRQHAGLDPGAPGKSTDCLAAIAAPLRW